MEGGTVTDCAVWVDNFAYSGPMGEDEAKQMAKKNAEDLAAYLMSQIYVVHSPDFKVWTVVSGHKAERTFSVMPYAPLE
jgi:hypothetical protein